MSTWKVEQQTNLLTNETTQSIDVLRMLEERVSDLAGILHNGLQHAQADLDHLWVGGRRQREVQQDFLRSKLVQILVPLANEPTIVATFSLRCRGLFSFWSSAINRGTNPCSMMNRFCLFEPMMRFLICVVAS